MRSNATFTVDQRVRIDTLTGPRVGILGIHGNIVNNVQAAPSRRAPHPFLQVPGFGTRTSTARRAFHRQEMMKKVPVVFLSADPTHRLSLDEDLRKVKEKVRAAEYRDVLAFDVCPAARVDDLVQALYVTKPQIVHFSGHGKPDGLMMMGPDGDTPDWVGGKELTELFSTFRDEIRLVVLSACSTHRQAKAIAEVVGCAIGTPAKIQDEAAIAFNAEFYRAIAFGKSVKSAYEKACAVLGVTELDEVRPELAVRAGVDPAELILISRPMPALWVSVAAVLCVVVALSTAQMLGGLDTRRPAVAGPDTVSLSLVDLAAAREYYRAGDYAVSFPLFKRAAEAGNAEAMGYLGTAYLHGEGTARTPELAAHWLSLAANARDARGMNAYGFAFENGFGVGKSYRFARQWYEAAARKNSAEAMRNLGRLYRKGLGMEPQDSVALYWYQQAANAGSEEAMADIGLMYAEGVDGRRDPDQARQWLQRAANEGSRRAMEAVARLYR